MSDDRSDQRDYSAPAVADVPDPAPRQVWEVVHPRERERRRFVRIDRIITKDDALYAECRSWYDGAPELSRATEIRVDRFTWRPEGDGFRYLYTLPVDLVPEQQTAPAEVWMTTGQVAARLKVDPSTVWRMAEDGVLPCERHGRNRYRRFRKTDVDNYLEEQENPT